MKKKKFFKINLISFADGQCSYRHPRRRYNRGCDQCPTTQRRRCGNPASSAQSSLLQNADFLRLLRRNAIRHVQARPQMRRLWHEFSQKVKLNFYLVNLVIFGIFAIFSNLSIFAIFAIYDLFRFCVIWWSRYFLIFFCYFYGFCDWFEFVNFCDFLVILLIWRFQSFWWFSLILLIS